MEGEVKCSLYTLFVEIPGLHKSELKSLINQAYHHSSDIRLTVFITNLSFIKYIILKI